MWWVLVGSSARLSKGTNFNISKVEGGSFDIFFKKCPLSIKFVRKHDEYSYKNSSKEYVSCFLKPPAFFLAFGYTDPIYLYNIIFYALCFYFWSVCEAEVLNSIRETLY